MPRCFARRLSILDAFAVFLVLADRRFDFIGVGIGVVIDSRQVGRPQRWVRLENLCIRRTKALTVYDCPNLDAQIADTCLSAAAIRFFGCEVRYRGHEPSLWHKLRRVNPEATSPWLLTCVPLAHLKSFIVLALRDTRGREPLAINGGPVRGQDLFRPDGQIARLFPTCFFSLSSLRTSISAWCHFPDRL